MEEKGIVIGIVKENAHPVRMGNIMVFIPGRGATGQTLQGDARSIEDDPAQWRMVRYATPWYSRTDTTSQTNNYTDVKNTAGIIYPAPDIGTKVLCFFPEGKNAEGFWFACAPDPYMMQSLPEPTPTNNFDNSGSITPRGPVPAGEFNDRSTDTRSLSNYSTVSRPMQEDFYTNIVKQGIDQSTSKGISNSGYMRETPAELIGITTKGRRIDAQGKDIKDRSDIISALQRGDQTQGVAGDRLKTLKGFTRAKGHSFILDDGDVRGNDQVVRLRSAKGAQFLIHDTEEFVYIINQSGNAWMSMDKHGQIDIYSEKNINFRSTNINFHAEKDIKMHAGNFIDLVSDNEVNIEAAQDVSMHSTGAAAFVNASEAVHINSGGQLNIAGSSATSIKGGGVMSMSAGIILLQGPALSPTTKTSIPSTPLPDTELNGDFWSANQQLPTTVDRAPTHEPYPLFDIPIEPKPRGNRRSGGGVGGVVGSLAGVGLGAGLPISSGLGLSPGALGGLTSAIPGGLSGLTSAIPGGLSGLTSAIPGGLSGLTSAIPGGLSGLTSAIPGGLSDSVLSQVTSAGGLTSITGSLSTITAGAFDVGGLTKTLNVTGLSGIADITNSVPGLSSITSAGGLIQDFGKNLPISFPLSNAIASVSSVGGFSAETLAGGSGVLKKISSGSLSNIAGTLSSGTSFGKLPGLGNIQNFANNGLKNLSGGFDPTKILKSSNFTQGIGGIDASTLRGMAASQASFVGSGGLGSFVDSATGAIGKYGFTVSNLKDAGFVKPSAVLNGQMMDPRTWTGKDGMNSFSNFAANLTVQDNLFSTVTQNNMQKLANAGTIFPNDPTDVVAGLTNVANAVGINNAANIRNGKSLQPFPIDGTSTILSTQDVQAKSNQLLAETISAANSTLLQNEEQRSLFREILG
jgi:hypothetical protein